MKKAESKLSKAKQVERALIDQLAEANRLYTEQGCKIIDLSERLRELDEKNQTQALVMAARAVVINRLEDQFRDATKMIEQQKVAIDKAVEIIGNAFCLEDGPCPENYVKTGCKPCVLKWIGVEESP